MPYLIIFPVTPNIEHPLHNCHDVIGVTSWGCDSGACMGVIGCPLAPWQGYTSDFWGALYTVAMTRKGARAYNIQFFPKPTAHLLPS